MAGIKGMNSFILAPDVIEDIGDDPIIPVESFEILDGCEDPERSYDVPTGQTFSNGVCLYYTPEEAPPPPPPPKGPKGRGRKRQAEEEAQPSESHQGQKKPSGPRRPRRTPRLTAGHLHARQRPRHLPEGLRSLREGAGARTRGPRLPEGPGSPRLPRGGAVQADGGLQLLLQRRLLQRPGDGRAELRGAGRGQGERVLHEQELDTVELSADDMSDPDNPTPWDPADGTEMNIHYDASTQQAIWTGWTTRVEDTKKQGVTVQLSAADDSKLSFQLQS
ncbi:hypothetical protein FJTKL_03511 [Diaporthe vaccinii]|uniref:Transcription factor TFIIIC triple barrel domain-containing protein n=1 Tax=Diaporthe vaccinii TaxID=105482 RepID=A0ABR4DV83_9PEZI